jgi:hypothetical protein
LLQKKKAATASPSLKTYGDVLQDYEFHPKQSARKQKEICAVSQAIGLLQRRHVRIDQGQIHRKRLEEAGISKHRNLFAERGVYYSSLSKPAGSIRKARCAGIQIATKPNTAIVVITAANTNGSRGVA